VISSAIANPANWLLSVWNRMPMDGEILEKPAVIGWGRTLEVTGGDAQILSAVNALYSNVQSTIDCVARLPLPDSRKSQLCQWRSAFDASLVDVCRGHRWKNVASHFTPDKKVHLEYCAYAIEDAFAPNGTAEDLDELIRNIEAIQRRLTADGEISDSFRSLIFDLFEAIRRACAEYSARGEKGVMDSLAEILSKIVNRAKDFESTPEKQWRDELWATATKAATIATITGVPMYAAVEAVTRLLQTN